MLAQRYKTGDGILATSEGQLAIATKGTKTQKGVQLAAASSKAQKGTTGASPFKGEQCVGAMPPCSPKDARQEKVIQFQAPKRSGVSRVC